MAAHTWEVRAQNLPEHAGNPIHTDAGAQAAGFPRALVAGVTTYAYLTHPIVADAGLEWLGHGGGEVRFRSPVFEHDSLRLVPVETDGGTLVEARVADEEAMRASLRAVVDAGPPPAMRAGEPLRMREIRLEGEFGHEYGSRAGDDLPLYAARGVVHPAVWPALANVVVHADVARGSWIHTRSIIRHHGLARVGSVAYVHAVVVERFHRGGDRALLDVRIEIDGEPVATLEHEAIIDAGSR